MNASKLIFIIMLMCLAKSMSAQCELAPSCEEITAMQTIQVETSTDELDIQQFVFCIENTQSFQINTSGYLGVGIQAFADVQVQDSGSYLFMYATLASTGGSLLVNSYTHTHCQDIGPYRLQADDHTPEVLDMEAVAGQSILVEMIVPEAELLQGDSIILTLFAMSNIASAEQTTSEGLNSEYEFRVVDRSIGYLFSDVFYKGEEVTVEVDYSYGTAPNAHPEWLQTIIPHLGSGWEDLAEEDVTIIGNGGRVANKVDWGTECEAVIKTDLPHYCIFEGANGDKRLCNMLTEVCPCQEMPIVEQTALPDAWAFTRDANECDPTCSPSSRWGVGVTAAGVTVTLSLKVREDIQNGESLKIGITNFTDALTGCFDPSFDVKRPIVSAWSQKFSLYDVGDSFGFLRFTSSATCYSDSNSMELSFFNPNNQTYRIAFPPDGLLVSTPVPIEVQGDTSLTVQLTNATDEILTYLVQLIDEDGLIIDIAPVQLIPRIKILNDTLTICEFNCEEIQAVVNLPNSSDIEYLWSTEAVSAEVIFCANQGDSLSVIATLPGCDVDTFVFPVDIVERIQTIISSPGRICQNGVALAGTDRHAVIIDSLWGGRPPYLLDWQGPDSWFVPTEIGGKPAVYINEELIDVFGGTIEVPLTVTDSEGCRNMFRKVIPLMQDTAVHLGDFCPDGVFDEADPLIVAKIPDFDYLEIESVQWITFMGIDGYELDQTSFVVNEETSVSFEDIIAIQAIVQYEDDCIVIINYTLNVFGTNRSFEHMVNDFEVDFSPNELFGIQSILWDFGDGQSSDELFPTHIYGATGSYQVSMTIVTACDTLTITEVILVSGTSIDDVVLQNLEVFPNPTSGKVFLHSQRSLVDVKVAIFNTNGELLSTKIVEANATRAEFDLSAFPDGVYLLQVMHKESTRMARVLKFDDGF